MLYHHGKYQEKKIKKKHLFRKEALNVCDC